VARRGRNQQDHGLIDNASRQMQFHVTLHHYPIAKGVHYMQAYMKGSKCCCGRASERFPEVLQRSSTLAKAEKASTRFPSRRVDQHHRNAIQPAQL
jgi:hypothetical protein